MNTCREIFVVVLASYMSYVCMVYIFYPLVFTTHIEIERWLVLLALLVMLLL